MAFPVVLRLTWRGKEIRGDGDRPEGVTIRNWRLITKAANRSMAFHWHEKYLPLHFGTGAARRYGSAVVKPRTSLWLARKLGIYASDVNRIAGLSPNDTQQERRRKRQVARQQLVNRAGGANYNVYTGTLRQMVTSVVMVRAFPGRFRLEMPVPSYLPGRRTDPTQPDIRAELSAMLPGEIKDVRNVGQRVLTQTVRQLLRTGSLPAGV